MLRRLTSTIVSLAFFAMTVLKFCCVYLRESVFRLGWKKVALPPENAVANLVDLPCANESDISRDCGFHYIFAASKFSCFLFNTWYLDSVGISSFVVSYWDGALLYCR